MGPAGVKPAGITAQGLPRGWVKAGVKDQGQRGLPHSHMRLRRPWKYGKPLADTSNGLAGSGYCYGWVGGSRRYGRGQCWQCWGLGKEMALGLSAAEPIMAGCRARAWVGLGRGDQVGGGSTGAVANSWVAVAAGRHRVRTPLPRSSQGSDRGIGRGLGH